MVVGAPIAGRTRRELEELIGFFVNTLVLRADLSGEPAVRRAAAPRARRRRSAPTSTRRCRSSGWSKSWPPARSLSRTPLFQVVLTLQNTPAPSLPGAGGDAAEAAPVALPDAGRRKFDLTLELAASPAGLAGRLEYSTDLFDGASVSRFLAHWTALLGAAAADPGRPWRELPLLGAAERHQLLREWNAPPAAGPPPACLAPRLRGAGRGGNRQRRRCSSPASG